MFRKLAAGIMVTGLMTGAAHADPFVEAQGEGRVIVTFIHTESSKGFDNRGHVADISDYDQNQVYVQAQYGLTDDLTLLLTPSYRDVDVKGGDSTKGLGYTDVGARYRLAYGDDWLLTVQGLARIPGKKRADRAAQVGNTDAEYDLRIGGAYMMGPAFVTAEGGYRLRSGDPPNEFHADFTVGSHVTPEFMVLATMLNRFSDGKGRNIFNQSYRYGDAYVSGAYQMNDNVTLQVGFTGTVYGKNALRQRGPFVGLWFDF